MNISLPRLKRSSWNNISTYNGVSPIEHPPHKQSHRTIPELNCRLTQLVFLKLKGTAVDCLLLARFSDNGERTIRREINRRKLFRVLEVLTGISGDRWSIRKAFHPLPKKNLEIIEPFC
eukprot:sb/3476303/